jgi:hypothetical protein
MAYEHPKPLAELGAESSIRRCERFIALMPVRFVGLYRRLIHSEGPVNAAAVRPFPRR